MTMIIDLRGGSLLRSQNDSISLFREFPGLRTNRSSNIAGTKLADAEDKMDG